MQHQFHKKGADIDRYLIVNYEYSNFSVSQNRWDPTAPSQIISIPAKSNATTSKITKITTPSHKISTGAIIGIIVAVVALIIACAIAVFYILKRRKKRRKTGKDGMDGDELTPFQKAEMDATPAGKAPLDDSPYKIGEEMEGSNPDLGAGMRKGSEMEGSNPDLAAKFKSEMEGDAGAMRAEAPGSGGVLRAEAPGSEGTFRAEAEGSRGGWEMDGSRGTLRAEMPVPPVFGPVEMYAGDHGLYEMPSPVSGSDRPSPISSPHSPERRPAAASWNRRQMEFPRLPRSGSDISSPDEEIGGRSRVSPQSQSRERHGNGGEVASSASRRTTPTTLSPSEESDTGGWRRGYRGNLSPQGHTTRELPSRTGGGGRGGHRRRGNNTPETPGSPLANERASNGESSGPPGGYF